MREIRGFVEIDAAAGAVWNELTDFGSYSTWNSFITKMDGTVKEGEVFAVNVVPPGRKENRFRSKLIKVDHGRRLEFHGSIKPGILRDVHVFVVEPLNDRRTKLYQSIVFRGLATSMVGSTIDDCQKGLDAMNAAFKRRCEGQ
ncbi:MAG: Polyketide cyclase / dehydrase and lipid transport [Methanomassiliicoccales archaeon PtaU1.Bin124]|nr:MAG: Polyketide cyclase / dehydrase and lipid transport [Methanomassiliicoccales archaeon PtaU1.Bin124]